MTRPVIDPFARWVMAFLAGAAALCFGVALTLSPAHGEEVPIPPFMCNTSDQMQRLVEIRNKLSEVKDHKAAWNRAINTINGTYGPIQCWEGYAARMYPGTPASRHVCAGAATLPRDLTPARPTHCISVTGGFLYLRSCKIHPPCAYI